MRFLKICLSCLLLLAALGSLAFAEEMAEDITLDCLLNGYSNPGKMRDGSYKTYYASVMRSGEHAVVITAPEGKTVGGIEIKWRTWPVAMDIQAKDEKGEWVTVNSCGADFVAQYIAVPELSEFRIISSNDGKTKLEISEIKILTAGTLPDDIQVWRKPPEKVDLMMVEAHPDDEVLWFGGLLPTYAGEQDKDVLVVNGSFNNYVRRLELCDSLWTCGVDIYPILLNYLDINTHNLNSIMKEWGEKTVMTDLVGVYRQYKPDVVVLHDNDGEYGHGAHKLLSLLGRRAVEAAADETQYTASAEEWGTWDVPKVYVHLWSENPVQYDWHVPLERFDGLTSFEVATLGFACHVTQQADWAMEQGGEYDNSLFGLYRSTVGPDVEKTDMFENLPSRTVKTEAAKLPEETAQPVQETVQPVGAMATVTPEPNVTVTPQPHVTVTPEPNVTVTPQPNVTVTPQPGVTVTPEPNVTVTPQPGVTITPPPAKGA